MSAEIVTIPVGPLQANCYLLYNQASNDAIVIDPGDEPQEILAAAERAGVVIKAVFITHGHSDHLGASQPLAAAGAEVFGSIEAVRLLADPKKYALFPELAQFPSGRVDRELGGGETVDVAGIEVQAIATPGHSPGSITYFVAGGLFCGDLLFRGSIGRTDFPGGSFEELADSVKRLNFTFPLQTVVYPGHGGTTTLAYEKENNPFLTDLGW